MVIFLLLIQAVSSVSWAGRIQSSCSVSEDSLSSIVKLNPFNASLLGPGVANGSDRCLRDTLIYLGQKPDEKDLRSQLKNSASLQAFKTKLAEVSGPMIRALFENKNYQFKGTQVDLMQVHPKVAHFFSGDAYLKTPIWPPSKSFELFLNQSIPSQSECATGLQIAEVIQQMAIYGDIGQKYGRPGLTYFDEVFSTDELTVGAWGALVHTQNVFHGQNAKGTVAGQNWDRLTEIGKLGLIGLPGVLFNTQGSNSLDFTVDQNENALIMSVSDEAFESLGAAKGFSRINEKLLTIRQKVVQAFQKLGLPPSGLTLITEAQRQVILEGVQEDLSDPVLEGVEIFVHPLGVRSLRFHIERLLFRNPRAVYGFRIYPNNVNTYLFERFLDAAVNACESAK